MYQVKNSWQCYQTLDNILNSQRPQYDKSGIGFKGESSSTKENVNKEIKEYMITFFLVIQKKRSHITKNKSSPLSIQGMKEGKIQGRILPQVKAILTGTKQSFLVIFFIVKKLVINPSIARPVRTMLQEIRINKASHLASNNKDKSRLTTRMIKFSHYVMNMVMMNNIFCSKEKINKRMNPLLINLA